MDLSIVIVNYNVKELLHQSITSINIACKNIKHEIFVVDNASTDGSADLIREKFPEIKLIQNFDNKGFAAANNQALDQASGEFILLINPDTIVQEDTFFVILNYLKNNPACGMVGCKILNPDGSLQLACRRSFPTPWVAFTKIIGLSKIFPNSRLFGSYNLTYLDADEIYEVEAISGSFMFFRKQVMAAIGKLDESFFMYGEDLDWCFRVREAGWKIFYLPTTQIIHFKGESSKKSNTDLTLQFYRAMKLFVEKHYQNRFLHVPQWLLLAGIWSRASLAFFYKFLIRLLPGMIDLLILNLTIMMGIFIRFGNLLHLHSYLIVMVVYSFCWIVCLLLTNSYAQSKFSSLRTFFGVLLGLIFNTSLTFFFNQYAFSRAVILIAGFLNILLLSGWRLGLKIFARFKIFPFKYLIGQTLLNRRALVVAPIFSGEQIAAKLRQNLETGYEVYGIVLPDEIVDGQKKTKIPVLGTVKALNNIINQTRAREIIFSTEKISFERILEIISHTRISGVNFKLIPSSMDVIIGKASVEYIGDLPLLDINYRLNRLQNIILKRIFDIVIAFLGIVFTLPEFIFLQIFKQAKLSKQRIYTTELNKNFIYKFAGKGLSSRQKMIPALWSVLFGNVSLVGSKIIKVNDPSAAKMQIELKPGLTGLAQIDKNKTGPQEEGRYNLFYLKNYSIQLDIEIIIKTVLKI